MLELISFPPPRRLCNKRRSRGQQAGVGLP
nr:MAG TPA: hypothetical protein [Caudoviricetes sp.]DAT63525.1 MAG TPA: hypothetical protein [Caudoviricetes sp.]